MFSYGGQYSSSCMWPYIKNVFEMYSYSQWRAWMNIAWFLLWGRFGCRVAPSVVDFLICVSVHTNNFSVLGAYKHTYIGKIRITEKWSL